MFGKLNETEEEELKELKAKDQDKLSDTDKKRLEELNKKAEESSFFEWIKKNAMIVSIVLALLVGLLIYFLSGKKKKNIRGIGRRRRNAPKRKRTIIKGIDGIDGIIGSMKQLETLKAAIKPKRR